uniref:Peptidase metallopeptidase domain-containing protein n=1 Tax=Meloidogyne javanica TaxID=6303 RepID=A0A915MDQ4_MELJA
MIKVIPTEKVDQSFEVDKDFVLDYLKEFGHLPKETGAKEENITEELEYGIKHFQEFMNIPPKGIIDLPTLARMSWKRCGNLDKPTNDPHIWEKTSINWAINNYPDTGFPISLQQLRGLIKQAFSAWEIVIAIDFMEVEDINDANILFSFDEANENQSKTGLGIANGTAGPLSNIWLSKNQNWSIFQTQEEGNVDIFLTLIHEIGHSLGLEHIGDPNSVMFPMLERSPGEQLPLPSRPAGKDMAEVCPHSITAATNVLPGMVVAFNGQYTWTIKKGNITSGPTLIRDRFPDAPEFINASFSTSTITILIQGHTLFGYNYDEKHDKFTRAKTYPKMLHNRILFYPTGAFPLLNESIILINGKVYATYNVIKNEPHMLGNLEELYPNLPDGLLSGIPATPDFSLYYMLTANLSFVYNTQTFRLVSTQTIGQFIECEKTELMYIRDRTERRLRKDV